VREAAHLLINLVLRLHQKCALLDDIAEPSAGRRGLPYPLVPGNERPVRPHQLRALERRVHRINDLPAEIADAIEGLKMNPAHDHLNALLEEKLHAVGV
jgi:hypothetical protein